MKLIKLWNKREIIVKIKAEKNGEDIIQAIKQDKRLIKLIKKDNDMEKKLREKYPHIKSMDDVPKIGAFVLFNEAEDNIKCLKDYSTFASMYDNTFKIKEVVKISVSKAEEPSNILWENLEITRCESFF